MPTYDYECKKCQHKFEVFQSIKDNPLTNCPQCNGEIRRLIGAGMGIIFKGKGFYTTDYKKSSVAGSTNSSTKENKTQTAASNKESSGSEANAKNSATSTESKESKPTKEGNSPAKEGKSKEALAS